MSLVPPLLIGLAVNEVSGTATPAACRGSSARSSGPGSSGSPAPTGRPTSPAGRASACSPTCATTSSATCSGCRSASTSATAPASLVSRITNDVEALDQLVTDGVTSLVQNSLTLIGTAVIMFLLDWRLALATLTVVPALIAGTADLPEEVVAQLPRGARKAQPRHGDARRGHRRHARPAGVHARAGRARELRRGRTRSYRRREPRDGRPERRLLPLRRPALVARDRDRARLRRLPRLRRAA